MKKLSCQLFAYIPFIRDIYRFLCINIRIFIRMASNPLPCLFVKMQKSVQDARLKSENTFKALCRKDRGGRLLRLENV